MVMMFMGFDLGGVDARVVDDDQIHLGGIFHIDVSHQFWAGDGPTTVAVGQRELFSGVTDFGSELGRNNTGCVEFIEVDGDEVLVIVMRPLGMATGRFEVQHVPAVRSDIFVSVIVTGVRIGRSCGIRAGWIS